MFNCLTVELLGFAATIQQSTVQQFNIHFAPQALPQADGFSSFLGSAAPQALPQAEGFSSGFAAPQALPQALELLIANEATKPPKSDLFIVVSCLNVDCLIV